MAGHRFPLAWEVPMKKLLFVLVALMAAMLVVGVTVAMTRSGELEPESTDDVTVDEVVTA